MREYCRMVHMIFGTEIPLNSWEKIVAMAPRIAQNLAKLVGTHGIIPSCTLSFPLERTQRMQTIPRSKAVCRTNGSTLTLKCLLLPRKLPRSSSAERKFLSLMFIEMLSSCAGIQDADDAFASIDFDGNQAPFVAFNTSPVMLRCRAHDRIATIVLVSTTSAHWTYRQTTISFGIKRPEYST